MTDDRYPDWLANSAYGYGFGYTEEQALAAMAANVPGNSGPVEVELVEHHGNVKMGPGVTEADEVVNRERLEISEEDINRLRDAAIEQNRAAELALESAAEIPEE